MSIASLISSLLCTVFLYKYFSYFGVDVKYVLIGSLLSFTVIKFLLFAELKKIGALVSWWIFYCIGISFSIYQFGFNSPITYILYGSALNLIFNIMFGNLAPIFNPFKPQALILPFQKYIRVLILSFLTVSVVFFLIEKHYNLIVPVFLAFGITAIAWMFNEDVKKIILQLKQSFGVASESEIRRNKLEVLLADLSILWNRKNAVISLEELAKSSWLGDVKATIEKEFNFLDPEIIYFWENNLLQFNISPKSKLVIGYILEYLDKYGSCPSVVSDKFNDKYQKFTEKEVNLTTYDILATYSLITHSLNVAKSLETSQFSNYKDSADKLIIASLGHDLGKIQGNKDKKTYMTAEHPTSSAMILETEIEGYEKLKFKDEINYIIVNHHKETGSEKPLAKIFRNMDAFARRYEVSQYIKKQIKQDGGNASLTPPTPIKVIPPKERPLLPNPVEVLLKQIAPPPLPSMTSLPPIKEKQIPDFINEPKPIKIDNPLYRDMFENNGKPEVMELPWLDVDKILDKINKDINKIEKGWFKAITVNGDMVLVITSFLWQLLKMQAKDASVEEVAEISNNDMENPIKKNVLMSFVEILWSKGYIHDNWIKKGYYNAPFSLTDADDNIIKEGWFIPLRIEAFINYNSYENYESRKNGSLKEILSAKVPSKK